MLDNKSNISFGKLRWFIIWFVGVQRIFDSRVYLFETEAEAKEEYEKLFVESCENDGDIETKIMHGIISEIAYINKIDEIMLLL